jgi:hypothetical protein
MISAALMKAHSCQFKKYFRADGPVVLEIHQMPRFAVVQHELE